MVRINILKLKWTKALVFDVKSTYIVYYCNIMSIFALTNVIEQIEVIGATIHTVCQSLYSVQVGVYHLIFTTDYIIINLV